MNMVTGPNDDYIKFLTEVIKELLVVFGPSTTFAKIKNVPGIEVSQDGTVKNLTGNPQQLSHQLISQFNELSRAATAKSIQPIIDNYSHLEFSTLLVQNYKPLIQIQPEVTPTESTPEDAKETPPAPEAAPASAPSVPVTVSLQDKPILKVEPKDEAKP